MIDIVRRTVLAILNKENNGYITPDQFNLYARQAQLEIFEQYFYDLNSSITKTNSRKYSSGHGDISKQIEFVIDFFTEKVFNTYNGTNLTFIIPSDCYKLDVVTTSDGIVEIEPCSHRKAAYLNGSLDTAPSLEYPIYVNVGGEMKVYPISLNSTGDVLSTYVRFPLDPVWTYNTVGGSPLFNPSSGSYQDFELPKDDENNLIQKILFYSGVEIRDPQIIQTAKAEEIQEKQEQK